jgi:tRNA (adenine57-N1/adenine58-N1)-methyltransferase catalytic subunit
LEREGRRGVNRIGENSLALILYKDKRYLKEIVTGKSFHGKGGIIQYGELIGRPYGIAVGEYRIFCPTIEDIIMHGVARETQIVYPKDGFYIVYKLDAQEGSRILEIGTGSGALTLMLSRAVGPAGSIVSFEKEERHHRTARKNIQRFARHDNVELHLGDILDYEGPPFDGAFIDVREPWLYCEKVHGLVEGSGPVGMIVPTANQLADILRVLPEGFGDIEVLELMLRRYKTVAERVRPEDRMVAHTGYLVFARRLVVEDAAGLEDAAGEEDAEEGGTDA